MRLQRAWTLTGLSLLALLALSSGARDRDFAPQGALYLGGGQILEAATPRQLTLNAHVMQMAYQPGGLSLAYLGVRIDGTQVTQTVTLVGGKYGTPTTLMTSAFPIDPAEELRLRQRMEDQQAGRRAASPPPTPSPDVRLRELSLDGWSADGRFLLVRQNEMVTLPVNTQAAPTDMQETTQSRYLCIDVGVTPPHIRVIPLPLVTSAQVSTSSAQWLPDGLHVAFFQKTGDFDQPQSAQYAVYDTARDSLITFPLENEQVLMAMPDDSHAIVRAGSPKQPQYVIRDLKAGQETPTNEPAVVTAWKRRLSAPPPALALDVEERFHPDRQGITGIDSHLIWLRRTQGSKKMSALPVGLTPGPDDPQAQIAPNEQQVAFIAHGDLFVTDLSVRDATPREKLAAGDKLPCPEEQALAQDSLKQIGLAMMQYTQDYDETLPPAGDVKDRVMPYLKNSTVFNVGDSRFAYQAPPNLELAGFKATSELVIGTLNTPCARNVLYADGHVRSFPRAGNSPGGTE